MKVKYKIKKKQMYPITYNLKRKLYLQILVAWLI